MIYIKTPYGEVLSDCNDEAMSFESEEEAKQYLRSLGWLEIFINLCEFKEWK